MTKQKTIESLTPFAKEVKSKDSKFKSGNLFTSANPVKSDAPLNPSQSI